MLPRVENPIPETIGLGTIIVIAGTASVLSLVLATVMRFPERQRDRWIRWGTAGGLFAGSAFYLLALLVQLFCRQ